MNQFEQLKLIYNQFFAMAENIKNMVEKEEYNEALSLVNQKEKLLKKLLLVRKAAVLEPEEKEQLKIIEAQLSEKELENINMLRFLHEKVKSELIETNKKLKISNAYSQNINETGKHVNLTE